MGQLQDFSESRNFTVKKSHKMTIYGRGAIIRGGGLICILHRVASNVILIQICDCKYRLMLQLIYHCDHSAMCDGHRKTRTQLLMPNYRGSVWGDANTFMAF